jgi:hypothetical protein
MQQSLIEKTLDALTIDSAKTTDTLECPQAATICFVTVASAASSPVGTTIQAQGSLDGTNFKALDSAVSVTGNGTFGVNLTGINAAFRYYRLAYAWTSGSYVATTSILFKGEEV